MVQLFEFEKAETDDSVGDLRDYRLTYNATLRAAFLADLDASVPGLYDWSGYEVVYDGNDGTSEPVASEAASFPAGYTVTYADSGATATGVVGAGAGQTSAAAVAAAAASATSPSLFGAAGRVGAGGAWLAGAAGVLGAVALGAGAVW